MECFLGGGRVERVYESPCIAVEALIGGNVCKKINKIAHCRTYE